MRLNYAKAKKWKAEKSQLKYVQLNSEKQDSGRTKNNDQVGSLSQRKKPRKKRSDAGQKRGARSDPEGTPGAQ